MLVASLFVTHLMNLLRFSTLRCWGGYECLYTASDERRIRDTTVSSLTSKECGHHLHTNYSPCDSDFHVCGEFRGQVVDAPDSYPETVPVLDPETGSHNSCFTWFYSVLQGKSRNSAVKSATTDSFHIPSNSLVTVFATHVAS